VNWVSISWDHDKNINDEKYLLDVEIIVDDLYIKDGVDCLLEATKDKVMRLEDKRRQLLLEKEAT
jgi:hypothetical protein